MSTHLFVLAFFASVSRRRRLVGVFISGHYADLGPAAKGGIYSIRCHDARMTHRTYRIISPVAGYSLTAFVRMSSLHLVPDLFSLSLGYPESHSTRQLFTAVASNPAQGIHTPGARSYLNGGNARVGTNPNAC